ncbi:hypothetical protein [Comamonas jiangduensis]|uniref:hypothetical protein n=1 Tax=Comamonas jiangduensis TaxID=1194168 RepID=UPI003BF81647
MIYQEGISFTSSSGVGAGVGSAGVGVGVGASNGISQTLHSVMAKPPEDPTPGRIQNYGIAFSVVIGVVGTIVSRHIGWALFWFVAGYAIGHIVGAKSEDGEEHAKAMDRWRKTWGCMRCGTFFED